MPSDTAEGTNVPVTAQGRFDTLSSDRSPYLTRAEDSASLTIPSLMPPAGSTGSTQLSDPWQSIGARGVNNLASKLLLALFPPGKPFFRLGVDDVLIDEIKEAAGGDAKDVLGEIEERLRKIESSVQKRMDQLGLRVPLFETLKQLLVSGNVLLHVGRKGQVRVFRLDKYVVKRDPQGEVLDIVVKEVVSKRALAPEVMALVVATETPQDNATETVDIYTRISRKNRPKGRSIWIVYQEVNGTEIPGTRGSHPLDKSAWLPLRFTRIDGEDYGRGFIEEYIGDLRSMEALQQAIVEGSAAAARVIFLMRPGGTTNPKKIRDARNLEFVKGDPRDIAVLTLDKFADFRVAKDTLNDITSRLSAVFLLSNALVRQAERVTAEEIRMVAQELEDALGGVYSIQAQELQLPLVKRIMDQMAKAGTLPTLPENLVAPEIVTGLEGLGRGKDLQNLELWNRLTGEALGDEKQLWVKGGDLSQRFATALGVNVDGVLRTEEEVNQIKQQQTAQDLAGKLGPEQIRQEGNQAAAAADAQPQEGAPQ